MKIKSIIFPIVITLTAVSCGQSDYTDKHSQNTDSTYITIEDQDSKIESPPNVEIKDTCMLKIYYPNYSKIDLVCGEMPKKDNDSVILVCAAAYTLKRLDHFDHANIVGNHVSGGKLYKGDSTSKSYKGAFSFYDGKPHFSHENWNIDFRKAIEKGGCLFAQDMMIHNGGIINHTRGNNDEDIFRAICLIDGKLAVADSKEKTHFGDFIFNLCKAGATEAIYLDMGGWKHSWYRDENGNAIDIYPNPNKYGTNWITFYK